MEWKDTYLGMESSLKREIPKGLGRELYIHGFYDVYHVLSYLRNDSPFDTETMEGLYFHLLYFFFSSLHCESR